VKQQTTVIAETNTEALQPLETKGTTHAAAKHYIPKVLCLLRCAVRNSDLANTVFV
jgi:hypothetical protein